MASNSATLAAIKSAHAGRTGAPKYGEIAFSGNGSQTAFNIPHGLGGTPLSYYAKPLTDAAGAKRTVTVTSTNIVVTYTTAPASGTNNLRLRWGGHRLVA